MPGLSNYRHLLAIIIVMKHDSLHYYLLKNVEMYKQLLLLRTFILKKLNKVESKE